MFLKGLLSDTKDGQFQEDQLHISFPHMILTVLVLEHDLYTKHLSKPVQKLRHHLEGQVHISNPGSPLKIVKQKTDQIGQLALGYIKTCTCISFSYSMGQNLITIHS